MLWIILRHYLGSGKDKTLIGTGMKQTCFGFEKSRILLNDINAPYEQYLPGGVWNT